MHYGYLHTDVLDLNTSVHTICSQIEHLHSRAEHHLNTSVHFMFSNRTLLYCHLKNIFILYFSIFYWCCWYVAGMLASSRPINHDLGSVFADRLRLKHDACRPMHLRYSAHEENTVLNVQICLRVLLFTSSPQIQHIKCI